MIGVLALKFQRDFWGERVCLKRALLTPKFAGATQDLDCAIQMR